MFQKENSSTCCKRVCLFTCCGCEQWHLSCSLRSSKSSNFACERIYFVKSIISYVNNIDSLLKIIFILLIPKSYERKKFIGNNACASGVPRGLLLVSLWRVGRALILTLQNYREWKSWGNKLNPDTLQRIGVLVDWLWLTFINIHDLCLYFIPPQSESHILKISLGYHYHR